MEGEGEDSGAQEHRKTAEDVDNVFCAIGKFFLFTFFLVTN
jgi:hypothetical protein